MLNLLPGKRSVTSFIFSWGTFPLIAFSLRFLFSTCGKDRDRCILLAAPSCLQLQL